MIEGFHHLDLVLRVIRQDHLERTKHGHAPGGRVLQLLADAVLEHAHLDQLVLLGHAAAFHELA